MDEKLLVLFIYDSFFCRKGSKFKEWNMPSRKATDNSMVESLFILISALERLGEYVQVLPFAVMCKHLRPKVIYLNEINTPILHRNRELTMQEHAPIICRLFAQNWRMYMLA